MEVIHLILGKANPERMNGVNRVVHEMATNQEHFGYGVQVWGMTKVPNHDYPKRNFKTILYKKYRNPFTVDPLLLAELQRKKDAIVIHMHGAFIPVFYTISRFLQEHQIPFIITPHSTYNKVMMKKNALVKKIYFNLFERIMLNRAKAIHLLGRTEWEGLNAIYHNHKSKMIPYGFTRHHEQEKTITKNAAFTVGYCGRLSINTKGLDILIQGFSLFKKMHPDAELIIIGDGKEKHLLVEMVDGLNLNSSVHMKGSLFGDEKLNMLAGCDVFAHPSRSDGMPATIVEAASIGLPCVVSAATNMGEYIMRYDAGLLLKENNPQMLCQALSRLRARIVQGHEAANLRDHAFHMIDEAFDWKRILIQFDKLYRHAFISRQGVTEVLKSYHHHKIVSDKLK
jgi:glycosyltransferase involved in cell wall biosynthesis